MAGRGSFFFDLILDVGENIVVVHSIEVTL